MPINSLRRLDRARRRTASFAFILVGLGQWLTVPGIEAADPVAFMADYRAAVQRQVESRKSIEIDGVFVEERTRDPKDGPFRRLVKQIVYTRNPTHEKLQSRITERFLSDEPPKPDETLDNVSVMVQGAEHNFWLKKPSPDGDFAITKMQSPAAATKDDFGRLRTFLFDAWSDLASTPVAKRMESPGFRVERVEPEGDLIRVDFSFRPEEPRKPLSAGHFVVDPAQGMAIRRQDVRMWGAATPDRVGTFRSEATYRMVDGIALPDEVDIRIGTPTNPDADHMHFRATRGSTTSVPDSAFSLAAFGLGDVERPAPRSRFDFAYWAVGLAGVAFALSVFLKWRGRQLARAGGNVGVAG